MRRLFFATRRVSARAQPGPRQRRARHQAALSRFRSFSEFRFEERVFRFSFGFGFRVDSFRLSLVATAPVPYRALSHRRLGIRFPSALHVSVLAYVAALAAGERKRLIIIFTIITLYMSFEIKN